jgi:hypothetical protein
MISLPLISRYDGIGTSPGVGWSGVARIHDGRVSGSRVLLASGLHLLTAAHVVDALGDLLGVSNLGLGGSEGIITAGDSGGGLFVQQGDDWLLAGINSFITRWPTTDIKTETDGSLGDIAGATRVSSYTDWIEPLTGQSQTPKTNPTPPLAGETVSRQVQEGQGLSFLITLSGPATHVATVDFSTRDGSARAGEDYIPTHGTLILKENEWWAEVWVQTLADRLVEGDESFSLVLNNPQGAIFPAGQVELTAQRTILDDISLVGVTQLAEELFG